jgi:hypothetical protein
MGRSTAKFIAYDLRPAKQSERRILIEVLKLGSEGTPISDYRYVGMGGNKFYDFLLMHRYLGIKKMVSIEHDPTMYKRAEFNVPFGFIDVQQKNVAEFLATDTSGSHSIYWFDYDGGVSRTLVDDIESMATKAKLGDFCFVTVSGTAPRALDKLSDEDRLEELKDLIGDVAGQVVLEDVERSRFSNAVHQILFAAFRHGFAMRTEGKFVPLLQVKYSDTHPMVTVGGAFLAESRGATCAAAVRAHMPYLMPSRPELYEIMSFNHTDRERALFDRAVTTGSGRSRERRILAGLGFQKAELEAYRDMVRYFPRYVETMV